jgi:nucleoside-diphosphate-sugar epimerase
MNDPRSLLKRHQMFYPNAAAALSTSSTMNARKLMQAINVSGTDNVLSLALELGIPRSVYVSSTVFWGETGSEVCDETWQRQKSYQSYYEQTKAEAHKIAQGYQQRGLPLIIHRLS